MPDQSPDRPARKGIRALLALLRRRREPPEPAPPSRQELARHLADLARKYRRRR